MIYKGTDIVGRARLILMDAGAKAWTDIELYGWLNDGRSVLYQLRPDIFTEDGEMTLVAGTRQTVPDGSDRLFTIEHNVSHKNKRTISLTSDQVLDRFRPQWRTKKQSTEIEHYLYSEAGGTDYEVYPPAVVGVKTLVVSELEAVTMSPVLPALAQSVSMAVSWQAAVPEKTTSLALKVGLRLSL